MGKVHRIKRAFQRVVSQEPLPVGRHSLAGCAGLYIGKRYNGSTYLADGSWGNAYRPLMRRLTEQYEAGVAHSNKGPVTG